jgi:hypothetical protein
VEELAGDLSWVPGQPLSVRYPMPKFELTKSIEAIKLNKRTLRPLGPEKFTIPFGAVLENMTEDRDRRKFFYLGEPYEAKESEIESALKALE